MPEQVVIFVTFNFKYQIICFECYFYYDMCSEFKYKKLIPIYFEFWEKCGHRFQI